MSDDVASGGYYDPTFTFDSMALPASPASGGSSMASNASNPPNGGVITQIPITVADIYVGDVPGASPSQ